MERVPYPPHGRDSHPDRSDIPLSPPHDEAAEEAVIGSLLIDPRASEGLQLSSFDFFIPGNALIYQAIESCTARGTGHDTITVAHALGDKLVEAGGAAHLSHCVGTVPTSLHIEHYARIVRDMATRRALIKAAHEISSTANSAETPEKALADADTIITDLRRRCGKGTLLSPRDWVEELNVRYNTLNERPGQVFVTTGIEELNIQLGGGLFPGQLITIGAATGMGKTEFGLHLANKAAEYGDVLLCSAEMTAGGIGDRNIARLTNLQIARVMSGSYSPAEYLTITEALGVLDKRRVWLLPQGDMTLSHIRQAADKVANHGDGLRLVVVDFLQELAYEGKEEMRYRQLGTIMRGLAALAKSHDCPVVVLSQIARDMTQRQNKRPVLSDLKESGDIENLSDVVLLLWCLDYYYSESVYEYEYQHHPEWLGQYKQSVYPAGITEIAIAKLRQSSGRRIVRKPVQVHYDPQNGYVGVKRG